MLSTVYLRVIKSLLPTDLSALFRNKQTSLLAVCARLLVTSFEHAKFKSVVGVVVPPSHAAKLETF